MRNHDAASSNHQSPRRLPEKNALQPRESPVLAETAPRDKPEYHHHKGQRKQPKHPFLRDRQPDVFLRAARSAVSRAAYAALFTREDRAAARPDAFAYRVTKSADMKYVASQRMTASAYTMPMLTETPASAAAAMAAPVANGFIVEPRTPQPAPSSTVAAPTMG